MGGNSQGRARQGAPSVGGRAPLRYGRRSILALILLSLGCTVGPNYRRPPVAVPAAFRASEALPSGQAESIADLKWFRSSRTTNCKS
jgi:hypothetical protein